MQLGSAVVHDNSAQAARGGSCALLCSAGHGHGARMRVGGTDHRSDLLVENADQTRKPECSGSAAAQSIAVTAHTQRSQPLPPLPWEAAARKRLTLPSPRNAGSEHTLGLSTQTDRHWVQQALVWRSAGFNKSNWLVCTRPILGLRTRPQLLR